MKKKKLNKRGDSDASTAVQYRIGLLSESICDATSKSKKLAISNIQEEKKKRKKKYI